MHTKPNPLFIESMAHIPTNFDLHRWKRYLISKQTIYEICSLEHFYDTFLLLLLLLHPIPEWNRHVYAGRASYSVLFNVVPKSAYQLLSQLLTKRRRRREGEANLFTTASWIAFRRVNKQICALITTRPFVFIFKTRNVKIKQQKISDDVEVLLLLLLLLLFWTPSIVRPCFRKHCDLWKLWWSAYAYFAVPVVKRVSFPLLQGPFSNNG